MNLRLKLLRSRILSMSLKKKIRLCLFTVTAAAIILIGVSSYRIAERELIAGANSAVLNLQKQGGWSLDDRVSAFEDASFQMLQSEQLQILLNYSKEEAEQHRAETGGLAASIVLHSAMESYTDAALMKPKSGRIYSYYKNSRSKYGSEKENELTDLFDAQVDIHHPKKWIRHGDRVYFIRQIVSVDLEEQGLLCFEVDESFFRILGEDVPYLSNDQLMILNRQGETLFGDEVPFDVNPGEEVSGEPVSTEKGKISVTALHTAKKGWMIISYFYYSELLGRIQSIIKSILITILIVGALGIIITHLLGRTLTRNVKVIEKGMEEYEKGNFDYRVSPYAYDEVGLLGLQLNYMAVRLDELIEKLKLKEEEKKQMEIETLQAQINPHFLYNTLGSLKWAAVREGKKELAANLDALIQLLRFTIKKADSIVTVEEELDYIRNYIAIEQMRYGNALHIEYVTDEEALSCPVPGFILQPVVENSILHGFDQTDPDSKIVVRALFQDEYLCLEVEDNGVGMTEEQQRLLLEDKGEQKKQGLNSIGMRIVDRRLQEMYGEKYRTIIRSKEGEGTKITLRIPMEGER